MSMRTVVVTLSAFLSLGGDCWAVAGPNIIASVADEHVAENSSRLTLWYDKPASQW